MEKTDTLLAKLALKNRDYQQRSGSSDRAEQPLVDFSKHDRETKIRGSATFFCICSTKLGLSLKLIIKKQLKIGVYLRIRAMFANNESLATSGYWTKLEVRQGTPKERGEFHN